MWLVGGQIAEAEAVHLSLRVVFDANMRCMTHACILSGGAPKPLAHCDMKVPGLRCSTRASSVVLDAPQHRWSHMP
jgi:hypothetical protein